MKIVYLGTPEMAVPPLQALHAAGHEILLVVTRVDKKRGRGSALSPSPVKAAALELGIAVSSISTPPNSMLLSVSPSSVKNPGVSPEYHFEYDWP